VDYYLDEDVAVQVAPPLRALGLDVLTTRDAGRLRATDESQLEFAAREGRLLVTWNRDDFIEFSRRFAAEGRPHAGVLVIPSSFARHDHGGIARAIARYDRDHPEGVPPYLLDYLRRR